MQRSKAITTYNTVAGFVQFDPTSRKAGEQNVRDVLIQAVGSGGKNVKITIWPEFASVKVAKGDLVVAQGKFSQETVNGKEYLGLSANNLLVVKPETRKEVDNALDDEEELLF